MNEIIKSIYERKSVRAYEDRPIPEEMKQVILEAAAQAPTAGCQQLYTILDITDQKVKEALVDTCDHQPFIAKAPLVLIFSQRRMLLWRQKVLALVPAISEILSKIMRSSADCYSFRNMCFRRQCLCLVGQPNNRCSDRNHSV